MAGAAFVLVFSLFVGAIRPPDRALVAPVSLEGQGDVALHSTKPAYRHPLVLGATSTACFEPHINQRLVDNIAVACERFPWLTIMINLYDQHDAKGSAWQGCLGPLPACVAQVTNEGGMKVMFWTYVLTPTLVEEFDYVWCFDDDIFIGSFDLEAALQTMEIANVSMAQPVVVHASTAHLLPARPQRRLLTGTAEVALSAATQLVPSSCRAQSATRLETQTPIVRRSAWVVLHEEVRATPGV